MELYIIRHGQSANNALSDELQAKRNYDPPLTDKGRAQADCLAELLAKSPNRDPWVNAGTGYSRSVTERGFGITHLYTSAMHRALQTAAPVGQATGLKPEIWIAIHEHGGMYLEENGVITGYPGKTRTDILTEFPDYAIPDGVTEQGWYDPNKGHESHPSFYGRVIQIAAELRGRAAEDPENRLRIAIITHGTFTDALIKALFYQLPTRQMYYLHYNTGITRLDFVDKERIVIRYMNRVDHLSPELIT